MTMQQLDTDALRAVHLAAKRMTNDWHLRRAEGPRTQDVEQLRAGLKALGVTPLVKALNALFEPIAPYDVAMYNFVCAVRAEVPEPLFVEFRAWFDNPARAQGELLTTIETDWLARLVAMNPPHREWVAEALKRRVKSKHLAEKRDVLIARLAPAATSS